MSIFSLSGKTVLVTGASSGFGHHFAGVLGRAGARVVLGARRVDKIQARVDELSAAGHEVLGLPLDVRDVDSAKNFLTGAVEAFGGIDVLINNAGVVSGKHFLDLEEKDISLTYAVNTFALYWTIQAFLPSMLERDSGRLVTIASAAGLAGSSRLTDYSGSKHAAVGFMESLRAELRDAGSGVSALTVNPFYINTGMFDGVKSGSPLLPIQDQDEATAKILDAVESAKRELLLPGMVYSVRVFRLLPTALFDWIADAFGINKAMKTFRGRRT